MNAQILEHPALSRKRQRTSLASALETTEQMLVMARAGHWDKVRELETKRRGYLDECLTSPIKHKDVQMFSDAPGMLLSLNDKLVACVQDTQEHYEQQRQSNRKAVSMAKNYLEFQGN